MGHRSLAELLAGPPDPRRWDAICDLLDLDPGPEMLAAALAGLESWPDELREAPCHWLAAAARGEDVPQLRIVRSIRPELAPRRKLSDDPCQSDQMNKHFLQLLLGDPMAWAAILRNPHLADLRIIEFWSTDAESVLRGQHIDDERCITEGRAPVERAAQPTSRILSLTRASLPKLHTLGLTGGAAPQPAPLTLPPKNHLERLSRAFTRSRKTEWQRLLQGPGHNVEHWQLHVPLDSEFFDAFSLTRGLARWRSLDLWPYGSPEPDFGRLLRLPVAATLESLRIQSSGLRLCDLDDLRLPALRALEIARAEGLARCGLHLAGELFPALTEVALSVSPYEDRIDTDLLAELLQPSLIARIESLTLSRHVFRVFTSLLGRSLPSLSTLDVDSVEPTMLAEFIGNLPRLERLTVSDVELTTDLAEQLGELSLRELDLVISNDVPPVVEPLLRGAGRPERVSLRFRGAVREGLLASFARAEWLRDARELRLSAGSDVDDRTVTALLESPDLANLEVLQLYSYKSEARLASLRHVARPPRLRSLALSVVSIGVDDVEVFASGPWRDLEDVYIDNVHFDRREYDEVRRHWLRAVPDTITENALMRHSFRDYLRMPPCEIVLSNIEGLLRWGINAEQLEDLQLRARNWPEPLRSELQALIAKTPRIDTDG